MTKSDLACHIRAAAAVIDPADPCLSQDSKIECRIFYKDLGKLLGGTGGSGADSGTGTGGGDTGDSTELALGGTNADVFENAAGTASKGDWVKADGKLTLKVDAGKTVTKGTQYVFTFDLTNPAAAPTAPTPSIEANAAVDANDIAKVAMTLPGSALNGVANGANPFVVVVPAFTTKKIGQSTKTAGATNRITVTLVSATALQVGDTVTISGLTGAVAAYGLSLTGRGHTMFKDAAGTQSKGNWDNTNKKLTLTVHIALVAGTSYVFAFDVKNPTAAQSAQTVQIAATVAAGANIAAADMTAATGDAAPLLTVVQNYFAIGQNNPAAGGTNMMTVTLITATDLAAGDTMTITLLQHLADDHSAPTFGDHGCGSSLAEPLRSNLAGLLVRYNHKP